MLPLFVYVNMQASLRPVLIIIINGKGKCAKHGTTNDFVPDASSYPCTLQLIQTGQVPLQTVWGKSNEPSTKKYEISPPTPPYRKPSHSWGQNVKEDVILSNDNVLLQDEVKTT